MLENLDNMYKRKLIGARQDKKYERLMQSFDRILTMGKVNNDKFDHIEKRVALYLKRRYERENFTLEFQNKIKRIKEKYRLMAEEQKKKEQE